MFWIILAVDPFFWLAFVNHLLLQRFSFCLNMIWVSLLHIMNDVNRGFFCVLCGGFGSCHIALLIENHNVYMWVFDFIDLLSLFVVSVRMIDEWIFEVCFPIFLLQLKVGFKLLLHFNLIFFLLIKEFVYYVLGNIIPLQSYFKLQITITI